MGIFIDVFINPEILEVLPPFYFGTVSHTTEGDWITTGYALLIVLILAQELGTDKHHQAWPLTSCILKIYSSL